jgi:hypothetical protein
MEMVKITDNIEGNDLQKDEKKPKHQYNLPVNTHEGTSALRYSHDKEKRSVSGTYKGKKFKVDNVNPFTHEDAVKEHLGIKKPRHEDKGGEKHKLIETSSGKHSKYVKPFPLPKSEVDMVKARVDEGKSIEQKQTDRKARNSRVKFAAGSPKGSYEGKDVRPRKQGEGDKVFGKPKESIKGVRSHSASHYNTKPSGKEHPANEAWRKEAGGKLSAINRKNLKQMPNPDLPKSEEIGKAEGEKGVHQRHPRVTFHDNKGKYLEGKTQGTSRAGHMNIEARRGERDPQDVLDAHSNKLKELKAMPKPNLPKSEEMGKAEHPHGYSEKNPKIDIHHKGKYHASTNWSKTLKQAKEKHLECNPEHKPEDVKAYYSNPKPKKK